MKTAPIPQHEAERLADLRALRILDSRPELRFDRIVQLAAHLFQTPIAFIALVDSDRQWFKAKCGLTVDETGRDVSFCGHAILQNDPLIIPDATRDERFHDNPLVAGPPHLRFYAGHRLRGLNGQNVGTMCVADIQPREMQERDVQTLRQLSALAEHELHMVDLIEAQRELVATRQRQYEELSEAAEYVYSLLPEKIIDGPVRTNYRYLASSQLGGDMFGYHWLEGDRLAIYLLDACGHGVGASLLSVSAWNALRRQTLAGADFLDPGSVLSALNVAYPMEEHHDKFLTAWYGVYDLSNRSLAYASGGHHPALLFEKNGNPPQQLGPSHLVLGYDPRHHYTTETRVVPPGARLYLFSDGAFEIGRANDGARIGYEGLTNLLGDVVHDHGDRIGRIIQHIIREHGGMDLPDDLTLLEMTMK